MALPPADLRSISLPRALVADGVPLDAAGVMRLAAQSMFDVLAESVEGMMVIDREHRILWISEGYKRFLPALGIAHERDFIGRRVEEVVPNTQMGEVIDSGRPMLVDLLTNRAGTFLVSRLPLKDAQGEVIGALGMVLLDHPETTMQPLMGKFTTLQRELADTRRRLADEQVRNRRPKHTIASFIGSSPAALEVKRQARRVAQTESTVLLLGETGTGKELLAHAIHAASRRALKPLVSINIAAIPDTLLEAEFFGVAPGAYTGANRKGRDGKFKLADGGSLFLDEIGDMPLAMQSKLLRVLQEREVEPLGSNEVSTVDVRVIAATSRDLPAMVAAGEFRADLYYRLSALLLRVPPLRERIGDMEVLVDTLGEDIARRNGIPQKWVTPQAMHWLCTQPWPGNLRELRNVLEQTSLLTDAPTLDVADFAALVPAAGTGASTATVAPSIPAEAPPVQGATKPSELQNEAPVPPPPVAEPVSEAAAPEGLRPLAEQIAALEFEAIRSALLRNKGNRLATARILGISRASLYERLARWPELAAMAPGSPAPTHSPIPTATKPPRSQRRPA